MKIINTEILPEFEYFKVEQIKKQLVLHHTVSAVGKYIDDWFKADKGKSRVAVAYVVDKDGIVFKLFEPKYWAYHIGRGSTVTHNKESIGIEVVNEGPLYKRDNGDYYWWVDKNYPGGRYKYEGVPFDIGFNWRGYRYFASYTSDQYKSVEILLNRLVHQFNIKKNFTNTFDYNKLYLDYEGIVMHVNLRKDKTDLSKAYDIDRLNNYILSLRKDIIPIRDYDFE